MCDVVRQVCLLKSTFSPTAALRRPGASKHCGVSRPMAPAADAEKNLLLLLTLARDAERSC